MTTKHRLIIPKLFYFSWYIAIGTYMPFITLYYRQRGLELSQIGLLLALSGVIQIIAGPLWGLLADALRIHRALLPMVIVGTVIPAALIGGATSFVPLLILVGIQAMFSAPVMALGDSAVLTLLGKQRERYGAQRVWGAIGWGISTVVAGVIVTRYGLGIIFWAYPLIGLCAALAALRLPGADLVRVNIASAAGQLLRDPRWARFLGCTLLVGSAGALVHGFLSLYLQDLGAKGDSIGLAFTIASISELPVMWLAPLVLQRWGPKPLLVCAGLAYATRMAIYGFLPSPEWALGAQLLHGLCFATIWIAGVHEAQRLAPHGFAATAQSLFGTAIYGLSGVIANAIGGFVYQNYGYGMLFCAAAVLALLGAFGFWLPEPQPRMQLAQEEGVSRG